MSFEGGRLYPGDAATPRQILCLADEYRRAADALSGRARSGRPLSRAPHRLLAIHAIELYLNALLRAAGHHSADLRGLQHNLSRRVELAVDAKLILRARTLAHLRTLCQSREYLIARYEPAPAPTCPPNRLEATLKEVAEKAAKLVERAGG